MGSYPLLTYEAGLPKDNYPKTGREVATVQMIDDEARRLGDENIRLTREFEAQKTEAETKLHAHQDRESAWAMEKNNLQEKLDKYKGKAEKYKNETKNLKGSVKDLRDEVKDLHGEVTDLKGEVTALKGETMVFEGEAKTLKRKLAEMEEKWKFGDGEAMIRAPRSVHCSCCFTPVDPRTADRKLRPCQHKLLVSVDEEDADNVVDIAPALSAESRPVMPLTKVFTIGAKRVVMEVIAMRFTDASKKVSN